MRAKTHTFPDLNLSTILEPADPADKDYSATKVVATVGPACQSVEVLTQMLHNGMSAARYVCSTAGKRRPDANLLSEIQNYFLISNVLRYFDSVVTLQHAVQQQHVAYQAWCRSPCASSTVFVGFYCSSC